MKKPNKIFVLLPVVLLLPLMIFILSELRVKKMREAGLLVICEVNYGSPTIIEEESKRSLLNYMIQDITHAGSYHITMSCSDKKYLATVDESLDWVIVEKL